MKRKPIVIAVVLILVLTISIVAVGCSNQNNVDYFGPEIGKDNFTDNVEISESGETAPDRKIIYTASTYLTVEDLSKGMDAVNAMLNSDEWIENSNLSDYGASMVVRIKSSRLESFLEGLKGVGTVRSSEIKSKDVSIDYYDNTVRKNTLETEQSRLNELLSKAENISDILQINRRLSEIESELKQIQGTLNNYDSLIDYSKVTINFDTPTTVEKETFGSKLGDAYKVGLGVAENIFIFVLVVLPFAAVIGGIVVLSIFLSKKQKAKKKAIKTKESEEKINAENNTENSDKK